MQRAIERQNMTLFTPVGPARELAVDTLRHTVEANPASSSPAPAPTLGPVLARLDRGGPGPHGCGVRRGRVSSAM